MTGPQKILHLLNQAKVNFIVVGAYATIAHGAQQRTEDLDICHERTPANYKKLISILQPLHARLVDIPPHLKVPFEKVLWRKVQTSR
jgi:hypothetical protein